MQVHFVNHLLAVVLRVNLLVDINKLVVSTPRDTTLAGLLEFQ